MKEVIPAGWKIKRAPRGPIKTLMIRAPNGYQAIVSSHDRNPQNVLFMLADTLLTQSEATACLPACMSAGGGTADDYCALTLGACALKFPSMTEKRIDEIFDSLKDAPTLSFRYLVTEAIIKELKK
jgi:hypothetical protein